MAGVSIATVSHVVNNSKNVSDETRGRVEHAIKLTGFVPNQTARLLAMQRGGEPACAVETSGPDETVAGNGSRRAERREMSSSVAPGVKSSVLRALRIVRAAQTLSRAELARRLEVHRSTVTEIVAPLIAAGVLCEEGSVQDSVARTGRPPVGISLRDGRDLIVGVSVGGRSTQVGASTPGGRLLGEVSFDTPAEPAAALRCIRSAVERVCDAHPGRILRCVGVSVPGMADAERARLLYAPHLGWRDVAVAGELGRVGRKRWAAGEGQRARVFVENDATAAALYEARRRLRDGAGEWEDFALVRVGTGIGVGLVLGGEVFRGIGVAGGMAGEFGHMTIVAGGKTCVCGNRGCWERYAAEPGAVALYTGERPAAAGAPPVQFAEVVARAKAGERRAQATLERVGEYLGIGIGNMMTGLGVARVVVSGRIVEGWQFVRGPIDEALARSIAGRVVGLSVEPSEPAGAGLGGALEVAAEHFLSTLVTQKSAAA
jgi:predicted NBD/HSP70 family sugar kinase/plasmid maintenance system antidote protein VapI